VREDKARGDKVRGDKVRGDKARGDKARGDKVRGDKVRGDKVRGYGESLRLLVKIIKFQSIKKTGLSSRFFYLVLCEALFTYINHKHFRQAPEFFLIGYNKTVG
jgi:hypothetical protein